MAKKPYFDNNWEMYHSLPADQYMTVSYAELMDHKVANWELPSSVACVIRVQNNKTNKINEMVYRRRGDAMKKIEQLLRMPDIEFTVCDHEAIHHLSEYEDKKEK